jgi:hypothetical protein
MIPLKVTPALTPEKAGVQTLLNELDSPFRGIKIIGGRELFTNPSF